MKQLHAETVCKYLDTMRFSKEIFDQSKLPLEIFRLIILKRMVVYVKYMYATRGMTLSLPAPAFGLRLSCSLV